MASATTPFLPAAGCGVGGRHIVRSSTMVSFDGFIAEQVTESGTVPRSKRMQNRKLAAALEARQGQLAAQQHAPARLEQHSPRQGHRPNTAGQATRPKVTCAMLNETERMLLKAPNRHKSMLSAGKQRMHAYRHPFGVECHQLCIPQPYAPPEG